MNIHPSFWFRTLLLGTLVLFASSALAETGDEATDVYKLDVMSQNLYVGADVFRIFDGSQCGPLQSVYEIFETVQSTNFPERAEAIADIVMRERPHVIGLQEVSLIRRQFPSDNAIIVEGSPPNLTFRFLPNADIVVYDYLQLLMDALAVRGLNYVVIEDATSWNVDIEFPMARFDDECNLESIPTDLRLTDRDVILVRGDLATANATNTNFVINLPVEIDVGGPLPLGFEFTRGYGLVDVSAGGHTYRVANTHLEVGDADNPASPLNVVQYFQALELVSTITGTPMPLTVVGDFNSSPGMFDPRPAYSMMADAGYLDLWAARQGPFDPGFTCCHDENLRDAESALYERVDLVLSFLPEGSKLMPIQSNVVGVRASERSASGLWPSDHAGVVTTLKFSRNLPDWVTPRVKPDDVGLVLNVNGVGGVFEQDPAASFIVSGQIRIIDAQYNAWEIWITYSDCVGDAAALNGTRFSGLRTLDNTINPEQAVAGLFGDVAGVTNSVVYVLPKL